MPVGHSHSVSSLKLPESDEPLTCFACVVCRTRRTLIPSLLESEGIYSFGRGSSEDPVGCSIFFTSCVDGSMNPLPLASPVSNACDAYAAAAGGRGACTPSSVVCSDPRNAHPVLPSCHYLCSTSLYPSPRDSYVPTVGGARTAAAGVLSLIHI